MLLFCGDRIWKRGGHVRRGLSPRAPERVGLTGGRSEALDTAGHLTVWGQGEAVGVVTDWDAEKKQGRKEDMRRSHLRVFVLYSAPEIVTPSSKFRLVLSLWFDPNEKKGFVLFPLLPERWF